MREAKIVEVCPRDGFQSVERHIPAEEKIKIIGMLADSGIKKIQATSFVSPKAIAQMRDASLVMSEAIKQRPHTRFFALVPNLRGAESAVAAGAKEITTVISLSKSHNMANIRRTHEQSLEELKRIRESFPEITVGVDIATVFGCPFEGPQTVAELLRMIEAVSALGVREITLCDTIGVAYPKQVANVMREALVHFPGSSFGIHIHDTRNMGMINSLTALENGAESVQVCAAGLGGCPFAPGASGNTATEDFVYMLEKEGWETGINFEKLLEAARYIVQNIEGVFSGHQVNITTPQAGSCC
ncbi:MAG: hydroxymethylglutaryl-CoA lyase [Synergistaceae bacterium]|jgi:hydroxymethylglutaryl-CoA lyase|nr:hydroxymethylglutaryl-CoA lyase [Synergistaceae bacterium]